MRRIDSGRRAEVCAGEIRIRGSVRRWRDAEVCPQGNCKKFLSGFWPGLEVFLEAVALEKFQAVARSSAV
jgi:hypothetical protein